MQNLQDLACNKLVEYDKLTGLPEDKLTAVSGELCSSSIMIALEKFEIAKGEDDLVRRRSFILKNILKRVLDSCGKIDVQWRKECLSLDANERNALRRARTKKGEGEGHECGFSGTQAACGCDGRNASQIL